MTETKQSRLAKHLLRIGAYTASVFWLAFVYGGWELVSTAETGKHSHLAGWTILIIAFAVMIATMNHWVKYLQLILGGGILGGLVATVEGHLLNGSPFPRQLAAALTALLVACSLISRTLARRRLRVLDRVALIAFLTAFVSGIVKSTPVYGMIGLSIGFVCLFIAWLYDRLIRSHGPGNAS